MLRHVANAMTPATKVVFGLSALGLVSIPIVALGVGVLHYFLSSQRCM